MANTQFPDASMLNAEKNVFTPGTTYYLALFSSNPGTAGTTGELSGGSYARQSFTFTAGTNTIYNTSTITFTSMPAVSAGTPTVYVAVFSASSGGTYLGSGSSGITSAIASGASVQFAGTTGLVFTTTG